ncbi:hypothetical protein Q7P37_007080 [Cladosporium fusiforme]
MSAQLGLSCLHHEHHRIPVTALEFSFDELLLAGEGTDLVAYSATNRTPLASVRVFRSQAIHKIISNRQTEQDIIVYGGSLIAFVRLSKSQNGSIKLDVLGDVKDVGDWIFDASFPPSLEHGATISIALITAHNALVKCTFEVSTQQNADTVSISTETIVPGSNCILYCAHISWLSASLCLIASGTAFGDVIIWSSPFTSSEDSCVTTHYIFPAHEGSVFGVEISKPLHEDVLGGPTRVLASCSDDRTVRLWNISDLSCQSPSLTDIQRETGFGSTDENNAYAPPLLVKAMGHISRIWTVKFVSDRTNDIDSASYQSDTSTLALASFGEDANRITWRIKITRNEGRLTYELYQTRTQPLHTGKNIWSSTVNDSRCATGGADGSISLLPSVADGPKIFEISDALLHLPSEETYGPSKDTFKSYAFVNRETLIATTAQGRVVALTLNEDGTADLQPFGEYPSLASFSMVTSASGVAFIAGIGGCLHIWQQRTGRCASVAQIAGKVAGIFTSEPLRSDNGDAMEVPSVLVTTVGSRTAQLTEIRAASEGDGVEVYESRHRILELPLGFVATSLQLVRSGDRDLAVVGSRGGSLAVFPLLATLEGNPIACTQTVQNCHGKDAVTAMKWRADADAGYLFSTGRDGTYAVHQLACHDSMLSFKKVHQLELPFGPNIEGIAITDDDHLQLWGFKSKNFVAHDATVQRDVTTIQCGGVHRNWDYEPTSTGGIFAWTKASTLMRITRSELPYRSIHSGGHGREIKSLAISPDAHQIIATGAEDTDIKLFTYSSKDSFKCLQTLRKHNTGIQHLQWSADGRYLFSSGGFEEFHVWRVHHDIPLVSIGVVCESSHPRSGKSDLRIMGFDAIERTTGLNQDTIFDVTMVYSDSSIKSWRYKESAWELLASGDYLTACLTDVMRLPSLETPPSAGKLLTTATDGHIASWNTTLTEELSWERRSKVHQNAILDASTQLLEDGTALFVTASDDNGIGLSRVTADGEITSLLLPRAHAAAVTAVAVHKISDDRLQVISASIDQRIKLWEVHIDITATGTEAFTLRKAQNVFTSVADVSSLALLKLEDGTTGVLVCGVGMDVWSLRDTSLSHST